MILGLDTSCYTSSLAIISQTGAIDYERRILLSVKPGEKGLQQSAAVFQHLQNLPQLLAGRLASNISIVAAAIRPRPIPGSYLPVFKVSASFGEMIAQILGAKFVATSHQEGHIRAGLFDSPGLEMPMLAWHISGGTTELLQVEPAISPGYQILKLGGSSDLQIGQFIDRVGVALGTGFPAGPALEKLALGSITSKTFPVVTRGLELSFSGPETAAQKEINALKPGLDGAVPPEAAAEIARRVFNCICRSLLKVTIQAVAEFKINRVLLVGGVASSEIIREFFWVEGPPLGIRFYFGPKELASDNAVGVGLIGYDYLRGGARSRA
ncbi:MAG TPA: O-sialoglycoprotein endopeptidase [Bacillota bacterium]|nr:O-sialoglycoprotein endopeptidase [Bacillota bacterium]